MKKMEKTLHLKIINDIEQDIVHTLTDKEGDFDTFFVAPSLKKFTKYINHDPMSNQIAKKDGESLGILSHYEMAWSQKESQNHGFTEQEFPYFEKFVLGHLRTSSLLKDYPNTEFYITRHEGNIMHSLLLNAYTPLKLGKKELKPYELKKFRELSDKICDFGSQISKEYYKIVD